MKTPVIQNPDDPVGEPVTAPTGIGPRPSDGIVAWLRVWRVRHRRQAIFGVVVLVVALLAVGSVVATRKPTVTMGPATPPINSGDSPDFAAIDRYVQAEMATQRIPGLALGIVEGDQIVHLRGFGRADQSGRPVTPQTPFFAGSTTKSFTALAVMQLHEAGEVDLDAPVQRYLPWWRVADADASATITVRQLLYQVSGLSKATGNKHATSGDSSDSALEDQVRDLQSDTLTKPVGATWQYSNANYNTLGMIVQTVSNQPYEAYVQQHILDPLEMRNSVMSVTEAKKRGLVTGYRYWFGFPRPVDLPFNRGNLPAGGLIASAEDMAHYLSAQLNDGRYQATSIISPQGMAELHRTGVPTGHDDVSYAMGWDVRTVNGIDTLAHDGSQFNAHANLVLIPDGKWGIVLMENAENSPDEFFGSRRMSRIADGVANMVKGQEPDSTPSSPALLVVFGLVFGILALQLLGIVRSVRILRRWRTEPSRRPHGVAGIGLALGPPALVSLLWAFIVVIAMPQKVGAPLLAILMGLPDLGYMLIGSVIIGLAWATARAVWAGLTLRQQPRSRRRSPPKTPVPAPG
jgi:CubicO group peptidase (beta-lactamase class C family)